jgi:3-hydroxyacyl-CoA dehydrogenase
VSRVAIVGAGSIGAGWAVAFAAAGSPVVLHDSDPDALAAGLATVGERLGDLSRHGLLDGDPEALAAGVRGTGELDEALAGAAHVQECAPEDAELKAALFARLDAAAPPGAVLASSSSAIVASSFAAGLAGRGRCLVAHPANPPYLLPVVELVPAPFTEAEPLRRTAELMRSAGISPVIVGKEIEGFVFNRLQGAMLREAYRLVGEGVVGAEDLDRLVRDGPGRRWSLIGPFETADLNTRGGIEAHAARLGPAYSRMGAGRGEEDPSWPPELVAMVAAERRRALPLEAWEERVAWRDRALMEIARARAAVAAEGEA